MTLISFFSRQAGKSWNFRWVGGGGEYGQTLWNGKSRGVGGQTGKTLRVCGGGGMDIFWNHTLDIKYNWIEGL